jgi:hypothetical protein
MDIALVDYFKRKFQPEGAVQGPVEAPGLGPVTEPPPVTEAIPNFAPESLLAPQPQPRPQPLTPASQRKVTKEDLYEKLREKVTKSIDDQPKREWADKLSYGMDKAVAYMTDRPLPARPETDSMKDSAYAMQVLNESEKAKAAALDITEKRGLYAQQSKQRELENAQLAALEDPNSAASKTMVATARQMGVEVPDGTKGSELVKSMPWLKDAFETKTRAETARAAAAETARYREEQSAARKLARDEAAKARKAREDEKRASGEYVGEDYEVTPEAKARGHKLPPVTQQKFINQNAAASAVRGGVVDIQKLIVDANGKQRPLSSLTDAEKAVLRANITNVQMALKNYYELGVIAGPDMGIIRGVANDMDSQAKMLLDGVARGEFSGQEQRALAGLSALPGILTNSIDNSARVLGLRKRVKEAATGAEPGTIITVDGKKFLVSDDGVNATPVD